MFKSMICGGHFENMQIISLRRHFSACQHWFLDSAYQITPQNDIKLFSSRNACTCHLFWINFRTIRKGHSCETLLTTVIIDWAKILDNRGQVDTFILDFKKAFDTLPHEVLKSNLFSYMELVARH